MEILPEVCIRCFGAHGPADRGGIARHHSRSNRFTRLQRFFCWEGQRKGPELASNIYIYGEIITIYGKGRALSAYQRVWDEAPTLGESPSPVWQSGFQPSCRVLSVSQVKITLRLLISQYDTR